MTINIIYLFYTKFLYKNSTYCILHRMLMIRQHEKKKTPIGQIENTSVTIRRIVRSADLSSHILTYHVDMSIKMYGEKSRYVTIKENKQTNKQICIWRYFTDDV